ncbi:MaoC/PaaZ C-terminal domain-containing protein [Microbacterium sp. A94]|uniref:MaoC/PaaZ C-terminal domain-containing protein n=1 Tax=Microbacterium sp. A94 TaxID=3450717 RepID=UPI003F439D8B
MTNTDDRRDLHFDEVQVGDELPLVKFPLSLYRLVMWAGASRDFNSIHHNTEYARATGAPEMYANTMFLMGMWERAVRDWMGPRGRITAIRRFRMQRFNLVGSTVTVNALVADITSDGTVVIEVSTTDDHGITVGPGVVEVRLHDGRCARPTSQLQPNSRRPTPPQEEEPRLPAP